MRILAVCLALLSNATALSAQDIDLESSLKDLRAAQKNKVDKELIFFAKAFQKAWPSLDDKDKAKAQGALAGNFRVMNSDVWSVTIEALVVMVGGPKESFGANGTKMLEAETKKKPVQEEIPLFVQAVEGIGQIRHKSGLPILQKLVKYKDFDVVAAAIRGLGFYEGEDIEVKRPLVSDILLTYTSQYNASRGGSADRGAANARERLQKIESSCEGALKRLTGQSLTGATAWWDWWNDSGKKAKDWPKAGGN